MFQVKLRQNTAQCQSYPGPAVAHEEIQQCGMHSSDRGGNDGVDVSPQHLPLVEAEKTQRGYVDVLDKATGFRKHRNAHECKALCGHVEIRDGAKDRLDLRLALKRAAKLIFDLR